MNKNSNAYIIIYATVMIVIVAALLSVASLSLKDRQVANVVVEKQGAILSSIGLGGDADKVKDKTKYIEDEYSKYIKESYAVDGNGERIEGMKAFSLLDKLKDEFAAPVAQKELPVFVAKLDDGKTLNVLALYGTGLWGPIWGYIALENDWDTIYGAVFDHQGETPGLGAEISTPIFSDQFTDKLIFEKGEFVGIKITKGIGSSAGNMHAVDAISGGTITSRGVETMLWDCLDAYMPFIQKMRAANPEVSQKPMTLEETAEKVAVEEIETDIIIENHE